MNNKGESEGMHYEGNCIRPPPEADSILLQVTLGCSHNNCAFCGTYKDKRFRIKDDDIILKDIEFALNYPPIRVWLPEGRQEALDLIDGALRGDIDLRPEWMRAL